MSNMGAVVIKGDNPASGAAKVTDGALHIVDSNIAAVGVSSVSTSISSIAVSTLVASQGAGNRLNLTDFVAMNSDTASASWVTLYDGTTASPLFTIYCGTVGGGAVVNLKTPIKLTANQPLLVVTEATATIRINAVCFVSS